MRSRQPLTTAARATTARATAARATAARATAARATAARSAPQLDLALPAPRQRGGARPGAGRKPTGTRRGALHRTRVEISRHRPVHVSLPIEQVVGRMRRAAGYDAVRRGVAACIGRTDFRIVHVSIQANHMHLIIEADDKGALSRGLRAFTTACARRINAHLGRRGRVFAGRYHATVVGSPRQARSTIAYVLNNWRRHHEHKAGHAARRAAVDPYASGVRFDGWATPPTLELPRSYEPLPVVAPRSWLLTVGWRRYPLIGLREVPGPDPDAYAAHVPHAAPS